jgi:hypothetical protein
MCRTFFLGQSRKDAVACTCRSLHPTYLTCTEYIPTYNTLQRTVPCLCTARTVVLYSDSSRYGVRSTCAFIAFSLSLFAKTLPDSPPVLCAERALGTEYSVFKYLLRTNCNNFEIRRLHIWTLCRRPIPYLAHGGTETFNRRYFLIYTPPCLLSPKDPPGQGVQTAPEWIHLHESNPPLPPT